MNQQNDHINRVAIVGAGFVGATFAYSLLLSGLAEEIILIDVNRAKAEGEAMDLEHSVPFTHPTRILAGDPADVRGVDLTVVTAGSAALKPGQTRLDLVRANGEIFKQIIPEIVENNPDGLLLIASNPVDVMTRAAIELSGFPPQRVIGSGTILDTARFRYLLSQYFTVDPRSVHAYIIGEHGDSEVPVWSQTNIAGMGLEQFCAQRGCSFNQEARQEIFRQTRDAAYQIIQRKGATYYAVASGLVQIVQAILRNQHTVLSVSSLIDHYYGIQDVCLSLPAAIGRNGIEWVLPMDLLPEEISALQHSAEIISAANWKNPEA